MLGVRYQLKVFPSSKPIGIFKIRTLKTFIIYHPSTDSWNTRKLVASDTLEILAQSTTHLSDLKRQNWRSEIKGPIWTMKSSLGWDPGDWNWKSFTPFVFEVAPRSGSSAGFFSPSLLLLFPFFSDAARRQRQLTHKKKHHQMEKCCWTDIFKSLIPNLVFQ